MKIDYDELCDFYISICNMIFTEIDVFYPNTYEDTVVKYSEEYLKAYSYLQRAGLRLEQIKDIKLHNGRIYALLKNGFIKVYDLKLREINKREFKFAIFSNIIARGDKLYIFEKTGYIIETDLNLGNERILKASEITDKSFASSNAFYYDNKMISIE